MLRTLSGVLVWFVFLGDTAVRAQALQAQQDPASNAALKYWQAFAALPTLSPEQERILTEWYKAPIDSDAEKLIDASWNSLLFLHRGTKRTYCDWSVDYEDGPAFQAPHLQKALMLGKLAALRARYGFDRGDEDRAIEDALALFVLGRHLGIDPCLTSLLGDYALEEIGIGLLAPQLPSLGNARLKQLASRLEALPPGGSLPAAIQKEKEILVEWAARRVKASDKETGWDKELPETRDPEGLNHMREALERLDARGRERALEALAEVGSCYDDLVRSVALPRSEFDTELSKLQDRIKSNPFKRLFLPNTAVVVAKVDSHRAQFALFKAAVAVVQKGPKALDEFRDPFGQSAFGYQPFPGGFELKSRLLEHDKPVTLTVGRKAKR